MSVKLLIFDMDGLMFDTERIVYRSYIKAAHELDIYFSPAVFSHLKGRQRQGIEQQLREMYGDDLPLKTLRERMQEYKYDYIHTNKTVHKMKGLEDIIFFSKEHGIKLAIASSSLRKDINYYLKLEDLDTVFDFCIGAEDIKNGKPAPDVFLKACEIAQVHPSEAIVLEDSTAGVDAAISGGIPVIHVEDDFEKEEVIDGKIKPIKAVNYLHVQSKADVVVNDLHEAILAIRQYM